MEVVCIALAIYSAGKLALKKLVFTKIPKTEIIIPISSLDSC